jgi:hypothetical protein
MLWPKSRIPAGSFLFLVFLSQPDASGYAARRVCQTCLYLTRPAFVSRACDVCSRATSDLSQAVIQLKGPSPVALTAGKEGISV